MSRTVNLGKIVPARGTDYWTSEDIAQIEAHCDDYADEMIADLEEQVEDLQKNQLQGNESGTSIDLSDSADSRVKSIELFGRSEQYTTTGAQLFNKNTVTVNKRLSTSAGNMYNENGYNVSNFIAVEPSTQYTLFTTIKSYVAEYSSSKGFIKGYEEWNNASQPLVFTTTENTYFIKFDYRNTDTTVQFQRGNVSLPYEEYTGGQASPSANWPQEIKSTGDNGYIIEKFVNNNLLNCNTIEWYPIKSSDGSVNTGQQGCHSEFIKVNKNFNYILRNNGHFNGVYYYISRYDKQKNYLRTDASKWFSNVINIEPSSDTEYIIVSWLYISPNDAKVKLKTQLEQGTVATTFIQHQEQTYTIPCQQPMRSIENVKDTFVKVNGVWYERHYISRISSYNGEEITTAYMSTTGELSTGATVDYVLITSTDLLCTQAQITALEAFSKARTYKNVTHIYSEDEVPAEMDLTYYKDTETIINDLITRLEVLESEV